MKLNQQIYNYSMLQLINPNTPYKPVITMKPMQTTTNYQIIDSTSCNNNNRSYSNNKLQLNLTSTQNHRCMLLVMMKLK